jgi:lysophospholipase L1-like esterase
MGTRIAVLLGGLFAAGSPVAAGAGPLPVRVGPTDENIRYIGRFDTRDAAGPRAAWGSTSILARFKSTAINVRIKGDSYFQIVIDGAPTGVLHSDKAGAAVSAATGLDNNEHTIEVVKRPEAWLGAFQFLGFELEAGGKLLPPGPRSDKRIEVIGDSISCGYGNEVKGPGGGNPPDKQNGYMVYGPIAARTFGGEAVVLAASGRCLWPENTMAELFDFALPGDGGSRWNHKAWVPGVVVIDLGTNDFSRGVPERAGWTSAYKAFVKRIRADAPDAHFFLATGPIQQRAQQQWDEYVSSVARDLCAEGDPKVHFLPFGGYDVQKDGRGGDGHPNVATHIKMAATLAAAIEKEVGWKPVGTK